MINRFKFLEVAIIMASTIETQVTWL